MINVIPHSVTVNNISQYFIIMSTLQAFLLKIKMTVMG